VHPAQLREELIDLARDAGLEVRVAGVSRVGESEALPTSGTCRVRGALWVVLSAADPLDLQLDILADALRTHAAPFLESRYLLPAVRQRVGGGDPV
jgi:hypothetical protein